MPSVLQQLQGGVHDKSERGRRLFSLCSFELSLRVQETSSENLYD